MISWEQWKDNVAINPWGSHKNRAADLLGLWEWHGERDSDHAPCRWRMHYSCPCEALPGSAFSGPTTWTMEWSAIVDDDCPNCGKTTSPLDDVEDLLDDRTICPENWEDDDD